MPGTAERRFCEVCRKDVHNLARVERGQADVLVQHTGRAYGWSGRAMARFSPWTIFPCRGFGRH